jgi:O-antigen/teichoic acid export membrane protein
MAAGAAWMVAFKVTERTLTLASTVILARLLVPADFGVVAMAMSIVATLEVLTSFSMDVAIIQRADVQRRHLDTAWTLNAAFGVAIALLLLVLARPTASFYRAPDLVPVMYALAAGWLVQGFENVGPVAFRRELDFNKEYWYLSAKRVATFLVTIPLAFWLRNYWALVAGTVAGKFFAVAISYYSHPFRPRPSLAGARELLRFSRWLVVNNILYFLNQRTTDVVIGRMAGAQALGTYNLSFEISNMPTTELAAPINRAVLPGYSKMYRDMGSIAGSYLEVIGLIAFFSIPAGAGIAAIADPFVNVVLGPKWLAAIPLIQVLAFYGCVASLHTNSGVAFMAVGRPHLLTLMAGVHVAVLIPLLLYATRAEGIAGAAHAVLATAVLLTPFNFLLLGRVLHIGPRTLVGPFWRPILGAAFMYSVVRLVLDLIPAGDFNAAAARLAAGIVAGIVSYAVAAALLWRLAGAPTGAEATLLARARSIVGRQR